MEKRCKKKIPPFKQALRAAFEPVRKGSEQQRANEGKAFPFLMKLMKIESFSEGLKFG